MRQAVRLQRLKNADLNPLLDVLTLIEIHRRSMAVRGKLTHILLACSFFQILVLVYYYSGSDFI